MIAPPLVQVILEAASLILIVASLVYFLVKKRNFWILIILGSTFSARLAGALATLTDDPDFHIVEMFSVFYILMLITYFFAKVLIIEDGKKIKAP